MHKHSLSKDSPKPQHNPPTTISWLLNTHSPIWFGDFLRRLRVALASTFLYDPYAIFPGILWPGTKKPVRVLSAQVSSRELFNLQPLFNCVQLSVTIGL